MDQQPSKARGGKREGAGRKPLKIAPEKVLESRDVYLRAEQWAQLEAWAAFEGKPVSAILRAVVDGEVSRVARQKPKP